MSFQGLWQCFDGKSEKWSWILVSASEDDNFGLACLQGTVVDIVQHGLHLRISYYFAG
ncbi:hypothetical protein ACSBR1_040453 [Camellia fascicularis]